MKKWQIGVIAVVVFMAGLAFAWLGPVSFPKAQPASAVPVLYNEDTVIALYNSASPAVVEITVSGGLAQGQGSGFLVDRDGHILTNNHVVYGASTVRVILKSGSTVDASVLGTDAVHDLALLKVDASALAGVTPLELGDSSQVKIGQMAIAVGSPFGLTDSVTVGVISGVNRSINGSSLSGLLQTDAALNPGNSGGPLFDSAGKVVGINTAVEAQSGARGIGFAVPSNTAKNVLPSLLAGKQVQRAWLGITGTDLTADLAKQVGVTVNQGAYIISVIPGSPAEQAGLKGAGSDSSGRPASGGDVITAVDGKTVAMVGDLSNYISGKQPGDVITLTVLRNGSPTAVRATLGTWPASLSAFPNQQPQQPQQPEQPQLPWGRQPRTPRS